MFRTLITAVLLITTVAGPNWCCCRMRQWLAGSAAVASQNGQEMLPSCCTRGGSRGNDRQAPSHRSCPCKHRSVFAQSSSDNAELQDVLRSGDRVWELLLLDISTTVATLLMPPFPLESCLESTAGLGGRDLLRAYQVMRC